MTDNQLLFPNRKISETFHDFALPMLQVMPKPTRKKDIEKVLKIAFTVWNSVVYADVKGDDHYLEALCKNATFDDQTRTFFNELIIRKRTLFGDDQRIVGKYKVTMKNGELNLWAEARTPHTEKDQ